MCPIAGLTNPPKSFLKIGQIRKGEMQARKREDGSTYTVPVDLDYFRVTFRPEEKECAEEFVRVYGEMPRRINIRFPFKTVEEVWDANYEAYTRGGLIAKAGSNESGPYWIFYRDHESGEVLVRNGSPIGANGRDFFEKPIDLEKPIYSYKDKKGNPIDVMLEPVGRLQVVVPEIAHLRVGYLEFRPGSPRDIAAISRELAGIDILARGAGKDISGIPMVLSRRAEEVTKNINGKLSRDESWVVHIELVGQWGQKALTVLERNAQPDFVDGEVKELPYDDEWDGEQETLVPEPVEEQKKPVAPAPALAPAPATTSVRPYPPDVFKAKYLDLVAHYGSKNCEATDQQRNVLSAVLNKHCFNNNNLFRHEFLEWLTVEPSTKNMTCEQLFALMSIMKIKGEDFNEVPDPVSVKEIQACHKQTLEDMKS